MNTTAYQWLGGLLSAISGAVGSGLGVMLVDPQDFNFQTGLHKLLVVGAASAVVAVLNYLAKSPLPGWSGVTTTEKTTQVITPATADSPKVVSTVKETETKITPSDKAQ